MSILVKKVRVSGFRGLENIEVDLEETTVLTGTNNSGKTSFLKALQIAFGQRSFISQDDFYIKSNVISSKIIVDILIVPVNELYQQIEDFTEEWEILFTTDRIKTDGVNSFIPLRTIVTFDPMKNSFKSVQHVLQEWPLFNDQNSYWFNTDNGNKVNFNFEELPFFYMDAQRDILEDTKLKNSYLGKMLAKVEYSPDQIREIEESIKELNENAVNGSEILLNLKNVLKELDSAMGSRSEGIDITPFTKKIRDLSKGLAIYYGDDSDSFSMEYHGMGTRSWSSLLTLKAFIQLLAKKAEEDNSIYFPVIAIEEPEAHLHPNAQKKLYSQISSINGQKIISTHSPYIAASSDLQGIRSFYKTSIVNCGKILTDSLEPEDLRKIRRQVINTRGEIFFSKAIVFFEGDTEEQALPILFEKHFGVTPVELGVDFIGVGGCKSYLPFIRFADNLNIPWVIFSDADRDVPDWIDKHLRNSGTQKQKVDVVVMLDNGNDFERQLINDGFRDEIRKAIISFEVYVNEQHRLAREAHRIEEVNSYNDDKLYSIITCEKTMYAPLIAELIVQSGKNISPKVVSLFEKVETLLNF